MWHHTPTHHYMHCNFFFFFWMASAPLNGNILQPCEFSSQPNKKAQAWPPSEFLFKLNTTVSMRAISLRSTAKPLASYSTTTSQRSVCRISTFEWGSVSSSWLELEGEGVADLLPGGEGEPWGSALRLTWGFSWVSALMGLGSIEGELFIRGWLRAGS